MMNSFKEKISAFIKSEGGRDILSLYEAVSRTAMEQCGSIQRKPGKRACYLSAEFLIGRTIYANLYNLGLLSDLRSVFEENGIDPNIFENIEDAALGNGGLGRLAACFLDSAATKGYALDGYGIRYQYGLFKQYFQEGFQRETADDWTRFGDPFSVRREDERVRVDFKDHSVWAVPYDMPVVGYGGETVNNLRLWQAEPVGAFDFGAFNEMRYADAYAAKIAAESISSVLYPNDDTDEGKRLRLKQQYFFASATMKSLLREYKKEHGSDFSKFADCYAIQLNDTHPVTAIPEFLRILIGEEGLTMDEAFPIVVNSFAYTNHTIMAEALEKWDVGLFCAVIPEVYPYVVMLDNRLRSDLKEKDIAGESQKAYAIVDENRRIHMARMAIYAGHSINGVAAIHTEILKNDALREWHQLYPNRFSNKTNGITQRRWLGLCNPEYAAFITDRVGDGWITNLDKLKGLAPFAPDSVSAEQFMTIKRHNKERLAAHIRVYEYGTVLNPDSIFDIQIKRLHEYKRQLLNAFSIMELYFRIKDGELKDFHPTTFLFGAKAAPGYYRAKGIIKYINEIAKLINGDPDVRELMKVVFVQNYNVSYAEKLVPAADVSEQISTAGTEASGTGNMKLALNGAVTLGTYDGANIEIVEQAGEENNYIFGARVEDIRGIAREYNPKRLFRENPRINRVVRTLIDGTFTDGNSGMFRELYDALLEGASWHVPDHYYLLLDFEAYMEKKLQTNRDYQNRADFTRKCILNTAHSGLFSSDRTIEQYAKDIWGF